MIKILKNIPGRYHITFIFEQVFVHGMVISALRDHPQILLATLREFKWTILPTPLPARFSDDFWVNGR